MSEKSLRSNNILYIVNNGIKINKEKAYGQDWGNGKIWGDSTNLNGTVNDDVKGDCSGLKGNMQRIHGDISNVHGTISEQPSNEIMLTLGNIWCTNICGDITGIKELNDNNKITGDVTNITGSFHRNLSGQLSPLINGEIDGLTGDITGIEGNVTYIFGDVSNLNGDCSGLKGDVSKLSGNCSGLKGDALLVSGNLDEIPLEARKEKPNIEDWV